MARELYLKVAYCVECPANHEEHDGHGTCRVGHFSITPSDCLDETGHLGFPEDCPLKAVEKVEKENNELKGRLAVVSHQLEWTTRELRNLSDYSDQCAKKYGWGREEEES